VLPAREYREDYSRQAVPDELIVPNIY